MNDLRKYNFIIIGAGFFGSVLAERIASDLNEKVLIIEKRNHIGGNCFSEKETSTGIDFHTYGTHIFHTSNERVFKYIQRFCSFNNYQHRVLTTYHDKVFQMPINLETINSFYDINLKPFELYKFIQDNRRTNYSNPNNLEETAINIIGEDLYFALIYEYTKKQWGKDPKQLPGSIIKRIAFRNNYNNNYFNDKWQGIPENGYNNMFGKMLKHPNISVRLKTDYFDIKKLIPDDTILIYTGPIDIFFNYKYGKLEWRSLKFTHEILNVQDYQGIAVMNYANYHIPYTRIHEPKHLHIDRNYFELDKTIIIKEYPVNNLNEPYYPIADKKNKEIFRKYKQEATRYKNTIIGGRLGDYKYYNMDQTIESALNAYDSIRERWKS